MTQNILDRIRAKRLYLKLSQEIVADSLGITQSTYSKIEKGSIPLTMEMFFKLSALLQEDPASIIV